MAHSTAAIVGVATVDAAIVGVGAGIAYIVMDMAAGTVAGGGQDHRACVKGDCSTDDAVAETAAMVAKCFQDDDHGDVNAVVAPPAGA